VANDRWGLAGNFCSASRKLDLGDRFWSTSRAAGLASNILAAAEDFAVTRGDGCAAPEDTSAGGTGSMISARTTLENPTASAATTKKPLHCFIGRSCSRAITAPATGQQMSPHFEHSKFWTGWFRLLFHNSAPIHVR
jgi:hypothetical protein